MRFPHAIWVPGPPHKQAYGTTRRRTGKGALLHDMDGGVPAALRRMDGLDDISFHFSNPLAGPLLQHYLTSAITWHAHKDANVLYLGIENEGRAPDELNKNQMDNLVGLLRWLAQEEDWPGFTHEVNGTLLEHRWFVATACPSGRIPWRALIARLESTFMTEADKRRLQLAQARLALIKVLSDDEDPNAFQTASTAMKVYLGVTPR